MTNINIALFEHFAQLNEDYMPWKLVCFLQHMHGNAVRKHYLFGTTNTILMRAGGQRESTIHFGGREQMISGSTVISFQVLDEK